MKDLTGTRYGQWTILGFSHHGKYSAYYKCRCDCGTEHLVAINTLRNGTSTRCKKCRYKSARVKKEEMTHGLVREIFDYNEKTGIIRWKTNRGCRVKAGEVAGSKNSLGYIEIRTAGKLYLAHRLIWLWYYGYFPENDVDHKDRVCHHNWITNLREVSRGCNLKNRWLSPFNTSGVTGVGKTQSGKWGAQLKDNYKKFNGGTFGDFNDAVLSRLRLEKEHSRDLCNYRSPAFDYAIKNNLVLNRRR